MCDISGSSNSSKDYYNCEFTIMNSNIAATCNTECVLPCCELKYDAVTSIAPWPRAGALVDDTAAYTSDSRFFHFINLSANATDDEKNAAITSTTDTDFFKSRFLQLNVQFGDQLFIELKDVAAFSVDAMGAQIGGVLSLWLGVTVMFAFEAFEFIYVSLTHNCRKEESTHLTSTAPSTEVELSQNIVLQIERF